MLETGHARWTVALVAVVGACTGDGPLSTSVADIFDVAPRCDAYGTFDVAAGPGPGQPGAKVVVISVDGLRPDAIFYAPGPNLLALACDGAYSWRARTIELSYTLPSHASMMSGFLPESHQLLHNELRGGYIAVPTVMSAARRAGKRVVLVVGKDKMIELVPPGDFDVFVWASDRDEDVIARALEEVRTGFDLLFVHLPAVDLVGHAYGWMSGAYLRQVAATDLALGGLLAALTPETTVILSADHGGSGYIHWSGLAEDVHIPWMVRGPGITPARALRSSIDTQDTAATVAHVLGLELDPRAVGRLVGEPWMPPDTAP